MKRNSLRQELSLLLAVPDGKRKPALRRSRTEGWMYATDAPSLTDKKGTAELMARLATAGWETREERGWILLRKPVKEPPADWYPGPFGPEAACCLSLLERHPDRIPETAPETASLLIRAGEEGEEAYEEACREIHRRWAERLRKGERLPDVSPAFFRDREPGGTNMKSEEGKKC